ncbi:hypothetical protein GCM10009868_09090 [Terrabacter aerolatus]|uniref:DUF2199 domain-containing protein n=1 Tax=Terrabacter aerolatus TaxID=422442 RepID=A0A512D4J4_9MICO|nr:DUF2199 domain-containing protein [Terrabacter aerolatus]GEO31393.1 hypothetical protein TAE01_32030 [Terrabacter aerolatus]
MTLSLDFTSRDEAQECPDCGGRRLAHDGVALGLPDGLHARFSAFEYDHAAPEVFVEVTFGRTHRGAFHPDETFAARYGSVEGLHEPACSLVTGGLVAPPDAPLGRRLTRDEALLHPRLDQFWEVNDLVLEQLAERHGTTCYCCGGDLDDLERHIRFRLPDVVAALPDAERTAGVGLSDRDPDRADFLESAEHGCFVRSRLRLPLTGGHALTVGVWLQVTPETAQRIGRLWASDLYFTLGFEGRLANALPLVGAAGAPVTAGAPVPADGVPVVRTSTDPALAAALSNPQDAAVVFDAVGMPPPSS